MKVPKKLLKQVKTERHELQELQSNVESKQEAVKQRRAQMEAQSAVVQTLKSELESLRLLRLHDPDNHSTNASGFQDFFFF